MDDDLLAAQLLDLGRSTQTKASSSYVGANMVVFWPPRPDEVGFNLLDSDEDTDGHWGMNWPVKVLSCHGASYAVQYDNGAIGNVLADHVSPKAWHEAPVPFGGEATPLEICEFAEVFNGSQEDPGSWPAVITNLLVGGGYEVFFPFHPTESREQIAAERIRRYRVWKGGEWRLIHPKCWKAFDRWRGTTIKQPMDLKSIREEELQEALACRFGCARCRYAGVGCLSCDFNRPNYRGIFQARLLPQFQRALPEPQHQAIKKEVSPQPPPSKHAYGKQANPVREAELLEPVSSYPLSPQQRARSALQKAQRKERRTTLVAGALQPQGGMASSSGSAGGGGGGLQDQQEQRKAMQQARQWALARAHVQANAEALAREYAHAKAMLQELLQELQDAGLVESSAEAASEVPGPAGAASLDGDVAGGMQAASHSQPGQVVGHKRAHPFSPEAQQALQKRQRLMEEVEQKRLSAEQAERELQALIDKEKAAEAARAEAVEAKRRLAEAQKELVAQEAKMEAELRAQLEAQLQRQLEQNLRQPRLQVALLENTAAIAENTAALAAKEMELLRGFNPH